MSQIFNPTHRGQRAKSRLRFAVALSILTFVFPFLAGCGSTTKVEQRESVGQQLLDLEKSYQDGIITEKEYERLKRKIVRDND